MLSAMMPELMYVRTDDTISELARKTANYIPFLDSYGLSVHIAQEIQDFCDSLTRSTPEERYIKTMVWLRRKAHGNRRKDSPNVLSGLL